MARINIEDSIWKDERFQELMIRTGSRHAAKGMVVELWTLAQEYWFPERRPIPMDRITQAGLQMVLETGLASVTEGGVLAKGTEEAFDWLFKKQEAGSKGGRASAQARKEKSESATQNDSSDDVGDLKHHSSTTQAVLSTTQADPSKTNPLTLSPSLFSNSLKKEEFKQASQAGLMVQTEITLPAAPKRSKYSDQTRLKMKSFVGLYAELYKAKYGGNPEGLRDKALIGKLGYWIETISEERALSMVRVFMQIDHKWINESYHSLWQFFRHLNRIGVALDSGQDPGGIDWGKVFGGAA